MVASAPSLITSNGAQYELLNPVSGGTDWVLYEACPRGGERGLLRIFDYSVSPRRKGHVMSRARLLRDLDLPGFAKIIDVGDLVDGRPYVFMEGSGESLLIALQHKGLLSAAHVFSLAAQLAQILERAYLQGLTYLELRPDSVLVLRSPVSASGPERIRVLVLPGDLVRYSRPATTHQVTLAEETFSALTSAMQSYIAPELRDGGAVDDCTIAYALGAVLHDALYGATPRAGKISTSPPHIPDDPARTSLIEYLVGLIPLLYASDRLQRPDLSSVAQHLLWLSSLSDMLSGVLLGGKYQLLRLIALGGMGAVCEAVNTKLANRRVAIKVLYPHVGSARVTQEINAAILAGTTHPDIVDILDHGVLPQCGPYIVMEYLTGETLSRRLQRLGGGMSEPEAIRMIRMIAAPIKAAHAVGVIHRDLKPDNIMLVSGSTMPLRERIKILDFGIARVNGLPNTPRLTRTGAIMGTPNYMAPEQMIDAASVTDRCDVFALGMMLYELLGGALPAGAHVNRPLRRVAAQPLMNLITRLTDPDPAARPSMVEAERLFAQIGQRALSWLAIGTIAILSVGGLVAMILAAVRVASPGTRVVGHVSTVPATPRPDASVPHPSVERESGTCQHQKIESACIWLNGSEQTAEQQDAVVRALAQVGKPSICVGDHLRIPGLWEVDPGFVASGGNLDAKRLRRFWAVLSVTPQFPSSIPKSINVDCPLPSDIKPQ